MYYTITPQIVIISSHNVHIKVIARAPFRPHGSPDAVDARPHGTATPRDLIPYGTESRAGHPATSSRATSTGSRSPGA